MTPGCFLGVTLALSVEVAVKGVGKLQHRKTTSGWLQLCINLAKSGRPKGGCLFRVT